MRGGQVASLVLSCVNLLLCPEPTVRRFLKSIFEQSAGPIFEPTAGKRRFNDTGIAPGYRVGVDLDRPSWPAFCRRTQPGAE